MRREIGAQLQALRIAAGHTQETMQELAGIVPTQLSRIENGRASPELPTLVALSIAYGVQLRVTFEKR